MAVSEGSVLGERFEVRGVLGRGGMATVYLAHDRVRDQRVALKVLHAHLADDPGSRRRLKREIQAASLVRHDAALVAWELHELDGVSALTLPFFNGETLAERVAAGEPLTEVELRSIGQRVAEVLAQAHRVGVLHRDVTPNNVMIDARGRSVLTDFGLARVAGGTATKTTTALGTVGYAAPEVYAGDRGDPRSDLYSLGAVLYFAATGAEPFAAPTAMGALQRQMGGELTPVAELRPDLPDDLVRTIESLLDPDPNLRPQGATDVHAALARHRSPERSTGPLPDPGAAARPRAPGTALQRALPDGRWAVIVKDGDNEGRRQVARVDRGRDPRTVESFAYRSLLTLWDGLKEAMGIGPDASPEAQLSAAVARMADLPPEALDVPAALYEFEFRLVDGVSEASARALAKEAKRLGFKARAREAKPPLTGPLGELAKMRNSLIAIVWLVYMALTFASPIPMDGMLALPILVTVALAFVHDQRDPSWRALPLAYGDDLQDHASEGYEHVVSSEDHSLTRGEELTRRAEVRLQALSTAIDRASHLPDPALRDLRTLVIELAEAGWLASRLQRLQTLQNEGEAIDGAEIDRLEQALRADEALGEARGRVESALTAAVAQLLEIAASASRTRMDLATSGDEGRAPELVASLRRDAEALSDARREVGQRAQRRVPT